MSCCGQKRQAWRERTVIKAQPSTPSPLVLQNPSILYFMGGSSLVIKGKVTGITYLFGDRNTGLSVDERDLPEFLGMGLFDTVMSK